MLTEYYQKRFDSRKRGHGKILEILDSTVVSFKPLPENESSQHKRQRPLTNVSPQWPASVSSPDTQPETSSSSQPGLTSASQDNTTPTKEPMSKPTPVPLPAASFPSVPIHQPIDNSAIDAYFDPSFQDVVLKAETELVAEPAHQDPVPMPPDDAKDPGGSSLAHDTSQQGLAMAFPLPASSVSPSCSPLFYPHDTQVTPSPVPSTLLSTRLLHSSPTLSYRLLTFPSPPPTAQPQPISTEPSEAPLSPTQHQPTISCEPVSPVAAKSPSPLASIKSPSPGTDAFSPAPLPDVFAAKSPTTTQPPLPPKSPAPSKSPSPVSEPKALPPAAEPKAPSPVAEPMAPSPVTTAKSQSPMVMADELPIVESAPVDLFPPVGSPPITSADLHTLTKSPTPTAIPSPSSAVHSHSPFIDMADSHADNETMLPPATVAQPRTPSDQPPSPPQQMLQQAGPASEAAVPALQQSTDDNYDYMDDLMHLVDEQEKEDAQRQERAMTTASPQTIPPQSPGEPMLSPSAQHTSSMDNVDMNMDEDDVMMPMDDDMDDGSVASFASPTSPDDTGVNSSSDDHGQWEQLDSATWTEEEQKAISQAEAEVCRALGFDLVSMLPSSPSNPFDPSDVDYSVIMDHLRSKWLIGSTQPDRASLDEVGAVATGINKAIREFSRDNARDPTSRTVVDEFSKVIVKRLEAQVNQHNELMNARRILRKVRRDCSVALNRTMEIRKKADDAKSKLQEREIFVKKNERLAQDCNQMAQYLDRLRLAVKDNYPH
ncbi:hypothetical protein DM01DRAFT_1332612 [Hesseltinella vesiculosa]|uniref:Uncharacterized protein n=1 Tax=Hesseltinella vesiculosa TaxID=101127 RepID=A0A1X2GSM4_9FUNG|nr:hypothetical protein DM01DRAFT_1332612 [Hesseltinella vesiculosa]